MNPPNSPFNPAAPVFRPPHRQQQHSPQHRPYHEPMTPFSPMVLAQPMALAHHGNQRVAATLAQQNAGAMPTTPHQQAPRPDVATSLSQRLSALESERENKYKGFQVAAKGIEDTQARLQVLPRLDNWEEFKGEYAEMQRELREMQALKAEYGRAVETLFYAIDELYAEMWSRGRTGT